jgi:hypothetical protein
MTPLASGSPTSDRVRALRLAAAIERRAVERGRPLTAREQLANLAAALNDQEAPPKELDAIADVLRYRPKPVSKPAKKRKRRAAKIAKETVSGR